MHPSPSSTGDPYHVTTLFSPDGEQVHAHKNPWEDPAFVATYERWADPHTTELAQIAFARTRIERGSRVLDVGTGIGALAAVAAERGCSVLAFDSSTRMVQRANHRLLGFPDARATQMDARAFDLDDHSFDAAFAIFSVTLMPHRDASLREMVRVVRPGGIVCLINWATPYGHPMFKIVTEAMEQLDLLAPGGMGSGIDPLNADHLLKAGCVDVSVEPIELPAKLPAPTDFLSELGPLFLAIPGFSALRRTQRANLESLVTHKVTHGSPLNWNLETTLGIGYVPTI
jgi:ubiquinone/menaquinone biosynthesis C-methylase UbiE